MVIVNCYSSHLRGLKVIRPMSLNQYSIMKSIYLNIQVAYVVN